MEIRTLTLDELRTLMSWAADEGWNPGLHDAEAFGAVGAENFIGAFEAGEMLSAISAVAYEDDFGFIGLYIARPDVRGRGYGRAVFEAGLARLANRTIGLDGVPEQQANYRSKGFEPDYGNTRYSGRFEGSDIRTEHVQPFFPAQTEAICVFDRARFPGRRPEFLARWLELSTHSFVYTVDGEVQGFGCARACQEGFKIGPLFATDLTMATALFSALATTCDGEVHIDVPDHQGEFIAMLVRGGLTPGFQTARMYRGAPPMIDLPSVFAVTSLELG